MPCSGSHGMGTATFIHTEPEPAGTQPSSALVLFGLVKLFSVRILSSIIHEKLTEFTSDLMYALYKYSPYGFFYPFLKNMMMCNKNYMKTSVHQKMSIYEPGAFYSTIKIDKIQYRSKKCHKPLLHFRSKHYLKIY